MSRLLPLRAHHKDLINVTPSDVLGRDKKTCFDEEGRSKPGGIGAHVSEQSSRYRRLPAEVQSRH